MLSKVKVSRYSWPCACYGSGWRCRYSSTYSLKLGMTWR